MSGYTWLVVGIVIVAVYVVGFFMGKKHGQRIEQATNTIKSAAKDTVGKL